MSTNLKIGGIKFKVSGNQTNRFEVKLLNDVFTDSDNRISRADIRIFTKKTEGIYSRKESIIFNLRNLGAIIYKNYFYILNLNPVPTDQNEVFRYINDNLNIDLEWRVMDYMFSKIVNLFDSEFNRQKPNIIDLTEKVYKKGSFNDTQKLFELSNEFEKLKNHIENIREIFDEFWEEDEKEFIDLSLTRDNYSPPILNVSDHDIDPHEHLDDAKNLIENRDREIEQIYDKIEDMSDLIKNAKQFAVLKMDNNRNRLIEMDLILALIAISIGVGNFFTSIFGMNIKNGLEDNHIQIFFGTVMIIVFLIIISYFILKKILRIGRIT